jgi:hypothetical protein
VPIKCGNSADHKPVVHGSGMPPQVGSKVGCSFAGNSAQIRHVNNGFL